MQDLKVSLIQTTLAWNSPKDNLAHFADKISQAEQSDLILLPEMFTTGFSLNEDAAVNAAKHQQETLDWMFQTAKEADAVIAGSIICKEESSYFNRMIWMQPDGLHKHYDKRHVFTYAGEDKVFSQGAERKIFTVKGWRILPQICYDLRFPVFARNNGDYDLYLNSANWPKVRRDAWRTLLKARAIENQSYSIGINRVGEDPKIQYAGDTLVYNPLGEILLDAEDREGVFSEVLSYDYLTSFREEFPFLDDSDDFELKY